MGIAIKKDKDGNVDLDTFNAKKPFLDELNKRIKELKEQYGEDKVTFGKINEDELKNNNNIIQVWGANEGQHDNPKSSGGGQAGLQILNL